MQLNVDPGFDADLELAQGALERGWVTRESIETAILALERTPGSRLLNHLPLTPDQLQRLLAPEGRMPPEIAKVAQEPTRRLGHYILGDFLHSGGMGRVHKAWDVKLSRWVALKCLKAVGDERSEAYFDREARLAAGLSHPNIAAIYESGRVGGECFIAMQLIPGKTLDKWGRRDVPRLVTWIRDAARAVAYANSKGIVHRDLKPTNVMVTPEGQVYVLDFGLARPVAVDASHSATGKAMGTPAYMSPEQARGEAVDARSDVYSLGATLFECLTGRAPFSGTTIYDVLRKVEEAAPARPRRLNPRIPPDLETIILKCLEKDAARRYRSAGELADDLDRYLNHDPIQARPASPIYRIQRSLAKRKAIAIASVASVVLAGVLGWWFAIGRPHSEELSVGSEHMRRRESAMKLWAEARGLAMAGVDPEGIRRRAKAAREAFERAIEVKEDASSLVMKARCLQLEGRDDDALKSLERAHKFDPGGSEARVELAKGLLLKYQNSRGIPEKWYSPTGPKGADQLHFGSLSNETAEQHEWRKQGEVLLAGGEATAAQRGLLRGLMAMGRGDHDEAAQQLRVYTDSEPWDSQSLILLGVCRYFGRDFDGALASLDKAVSRVPSEDGYCWRGMVNDAQGRRDEAIADFTRVLRLDPKRAEAYFFRGTSKSLKALYDEAIEDFSVAIRLDPKSPSSYQNRGIAKAGKGDFREAVMDFTKAIELDPKDAGAYYNRGGANEELGFVDKATADYSRAIELHPGHSLSYFNRGLIKFRAGLWDEAILDYSKVIELDPKNADAFTNRGSAKSRKGHGEEAIEDFTSAIKLNPEDEQAYNNRGLARSERGLHDDAISDFTKAIGLNPKYATALVNRGLAKFDKGLIDEAILDFTKAISVDPKDPLAWANRGNANERKGHFDEAVKDLEKALDVAPPSWPPRTSIKARIANRATVRLFQEANELHELKRYREAIEKFGRIVENWPASPRAVPSAYNIACGHALLGEKSSALEWLEKAVDMGWTDVAHLEKDPDLASLRGEAAFKRLVDRLKAE